MGNEFCMSAGESVAILSVIISILAVIVAFVAIMFGYNLTIFRRKIYNDMDSSKEELKETIKNNKKQSDKMLAEYLDTAIKFNLIQKNIDTFVETEIKDGIVKYKNGLSNLSNALEETAKIGNPGICVYILNQFMRIIYATEENDFVGSEREILSTSGTIGIRDSLEKNIKIVEDANMSEMLLFKDDKHKVINDCLTKLIRVYNRNPL